VVTDVLTDPGPDGALVTLSGVLTGVQLGTTRQGRAWCTATLTTVSGAVPVDVYPLCYTAAGPLGDGQVVTVTARVDWRCGPVRLMALTVSSPSMDDTT
jgi:DNA polymerase III subunit alpha